MRRLRSRVSPAPPWAWLGTIFLLSCAVRYALARHMVAPWIMIDEIIYSELAKSFAATGHFAIRGVPSSGYGIVYPVLISPAYRLFGAIPTVYTVVKAVNSVLWSLAAIPAYLLARRVVSARSALVVAVLSVAVPSAFYAGTVMTENAFYPVFLVAALALVEAVERPSLRSVVLLLLATLLAYETRAQAIVLVPAALTAPLLLAAMSRRARVLAGYRWLFGVLAACALAAVLLEVARGRSLHGLLGAYAAATGSHYTVGEIAKWLLWHVAELDLYTGVLPALALGVLVWLAPRLHAEERVFVAVTVSTVAWLSLEVAAFASEQSGRIEERNLFYVAPLLFTCLALWVERGLPRPRVPTAVAATVAVGLLATIPYERFIGTSAESDTLAMLPLWSLSNWFSIPPADFRWILAAAVVLVAVAAWRVPVRAALALPGFVLLLYALAGQPVDARTEYASIGALFQGITNTHRDWISRAVGTNDPTRVSVVWSGRTDRLTVNENEFFNRDVGTIYTLAGPLPDNLAQTPIHARRRDGWYVDRQGRRVAVRDVLTDTSVPLAGRPIARDTNKGLVLLRVDGDLRADYRLDGVYPDTWTGRRFRYTRYTCAGGTLAVSLGSDAHLFPGVQVVRAFEDGREVGRIGVPPQGVATLRVPLLPRTSNDCVVEFRVGRTTVPAEVEHGSTDTRALGIHALDFTAGGHD